MNPILVTNFCPNHKEIPSCACGENAMCHSCGEGHGSMPCKCDNRPAIRYISDEEHEKLIEQGLTEYAHIWKALAKR